MILEKLQDLYNSAGSHSDEEYGEWTNVPGTPDYDDIGVEEPEDWNECESVSGGTLFYPEEISSAGAGEFIVARENSLVELSEESDWFREKD